MHQTSPATYCIIRADLPEHGQIFYIRSDRMEHPHIVVALTGGPGTGKSTILKGITGIGSFRRNASPPRGTCRYGGRRYTIVDLPGTPSLSFTSLEGTMVRDFLALGQADVIVVVCDARFLKQGLCLLKDILELEKAKESSIPLVLCINHVDTAAGHGIFIDFDLLEDVLQIPVVPCCARRRERLDDIKAAIHYAARPDHKDQFHYECLDFSPIKLADECSLSAGPQDKELLELAGRIAAQAGPGRPRMTIGIALSRLFMILILLSVLWMTASGTGWISRPLYLVLSEAEHSLTGWALWLGIPDWLTGCLVHGMFRALSWSVLAMLLPLTVCFPFLALISCSGCTAGAGGRSHCRLAPLVLIFFAASPPGISHTFQDIMRLAAPSVLGTLAVLSLLPPGHPGPGGATGRPRRDALVPDGTISRTMPGIDGAIGHITHGPTTGQTAPGPGGAIGRTTHSPIPTPDQSSSTHGGTLARAILALTRTLGLALTILCRTAAAAVPAGFLLWLPAGLGFPYILNGILSFLDVPARLIGLDGVLLAAFMAGFISDGLVLPVMLIAYLHIGSSLPGNAQSLRQLLLLQGWTWHTYVCIGIVSLLRWPCASFFLALYRRVQSLRWTLAAAFLPAALGIILCLSFTFLCGFLGI